MIEEEKKKESGGVSRREFLKDAGLVVGGAAIGSTVLLAACGGEGETATVTKTVTTSVSKFFCPVDGLEFGTLAELQAHFEAEHGGAIPGLITLNVNGKDYQITGVKSNWSLAWVLREKLGLPGTKTGCNRGDCGSCTVVMNGKAVYSCLVLAVEAEGANIVTIEGLSDDITFTGIQKAIYDEDSLQCGYCAPGFIMASHALLTAKPNPTLNEVREALSGHICTCGNTKMYVDAVLKV